MQDDMNGKYVSISVLRIAATLAVVFLHTTSGILDRMDLFAISEEQKSFLALGKQYMNWAVPIFLMITGTLLLRREKEIGFSECITKYVKRVLLALFCFGIPFSMMEIFFDKKTIDIQLFYDAVRHVISGNSWAHLWYLYMLIGIYCILPVLKRFTDGASRADLRNMLITMFFFQICIPLAENMMDLSIAFEIPIAANTVVYLFLGKYLSEKLPKFLEKKISVVLYLATSFVLAAGVYRSTNSENSLEYFAPVYATLIFALCRNIHVSDKIRPLIWKIDRLCFGVYLIHPLFINFAYKFLRVTPISFECYGLMTGVFFLLFTICSFGASLVMSMVPVLKKHIL